jgi:hypothetical protein
MGELNFHIVIFVLIQFSIFPDWPLMQQPVWRMAMSWILENYANNLLVRQASSHMAASHKHAILPAVYFFQST